MIETVGYLFGVIAIYCAVMCFACLLMTGKQAAAGLALGLFHLVGCLMG